jgi:aromatic-L-amino-acid decarboxylase
MRSLAREAVDRVVDRLADLDEAPTADLDGADAAVEAVAGSIEADPESPDEVLDFLLDEAIPASLNTASPGYMAYVPGGGLHASAVADYVAAATNRYVGTDFAAPALTAIEAEVVDWCADVVGYPEETRGGVLTSGGSMAIQSALVTAREDRLPDDFLDGRIYVSDQSHHSVEKAARLAGFPAENIRVLPTDDRYRLQAGTLAEAAAADREEGWTPFLAVASGGTTNTGAVDDLQGIADVCREEDLWFHVDAAYGGFLALCEAGEAALAGMERSDSATLDPHKALFVPYGTGCLTVRDEEPLVAAHAGEADYLDDQGGGDVPDLSRRGPELTRPFRALRVWLPLRLCGVEAFREAAAEKVALAREAADELASVPHLEVVAAPQLSTLAFRFDPEAVPGDADAWTQALLEAVNARQRVHLSGTRLDVGYVARICVVSFRTGPGDLRACLEDVQAAAEELLEEKGVG